MTQIDIAREFSASGEHRRALRVLRGLLAREAFHGNMFGMIIATMIDILLKTEDAEAATSWYAYWKEFETDADKLKPYEALEVLTGLVKLTESGAKNEVLSAKRAKTGKGVAKKKAVPSKGLEPPLPKDPPLQPELF